MLQRIKIMAGTLRHGQRHGVRAKRLESPGTKVSKVAFLFKCVSGSSSGLFWPLWKWSCSGGIVAGIGNWFRITPFAGLRRRFRGEKRG